MLKVNDEIIGLESLEQAALRPAPTGIEGENTLHNALGDLIKTYHHLNPTTITTLSEPPSPLEFFRHISRNTPFVIHGGASDWPALQKWSASYLATTLEGQLVDVAITPHGNADSVIEIPSGGSVFVKPFETTMRFEEALRIIQAQSWGDRTSTPEVDQAILYLQSQNNNLATEYPILYSDIPDSIPFARIALDQQKPDAVNFWLGNEWSTTALHRDHYENLYVQILGTKTFSLLSPVEAACVAEKSVLAGTYALKPGVDLAAGGTVKKTDLHIAIDKPLTYIPCATWDPHFPNHNTTPFTCLARSMHVTLHPGDILYLPAMWYHQVMQGVSVEGVSCAVNYWYDLDFGGPFWSTMGFVRGLGMLAGKEEKTEEAEKAAALEKTKHATQQSKKS